MKNIKEIELHSKKDIDGKPVYQSVFLMAPMQGTFQKFPYEVLKIELDPNNSKRGWLWVNQKGDVKKVEYRDGYKGELNLNKAGGKKVELQNAHNAMYGLEVAGGTLGETMKKEDLKNVIKEIIREALKEQSYKVGGRSYRTFQDSPQITQHHDPEVTEDHDEMDMDNPEEKREVEIAKEVKNLVDVFAMDHTHPWIKHKMRILKLMDELLKMHGSE